MQNESGPNLESPELSRRRTEARLKRSRAAKTTQPEPNQTKPETLQGPEDPKQTKAKHRVNWVCSFVEDMAMGQNPVPPVNMPIPTKIKPKMGGAPIPRWDPIGFEPWPYPFRMGQKGNQPEHFVS